MLCFLFWFVALSLVTATDELSDSTLKLTMRFVISVIEAELPDLGELRFNAIEPGSVRWRPNQTNVVFSSPASYFWTLVL